MESAQWVIAISTAIIAVFFLIFAVFWIRAVVTLKKEIHLLSNDIERRIQALDNTWKNVLGLNPIDSTGSTNEPSRKLPMILRGVVFATALWRNIQKRR